MVPRNGYLSFASYANIAFGNLGVSGREEVRTVISDIRSFQRMALKRIKKSRADLTEHINKLPEELCLARGHFL